MALYALYNRFTKLYNLCDAYALTNGYSHDLAIHTLYNTLSLLHDIYLTKHEPYSNTDALKVSYGV